MLFANNINSYQEFVIALYQDIMVIQVCKHYHQKLNIELQQMIQIEHLLSRCNYNWLRLSYYNASQCFWNILRLGGSPPLTFKTSVVYRHWRLNFHFFCTFFSGCDQNVSVSVALGATFKTFIGQCPCFLVLIHYVIRYSIANQCSNLFLSFALSVLTQGCSNLIQNENCMENFNGENYF